jgi:hypothetical protein
VDLGFAGVLLQHEVQHLHIILDGFEELILLALEQALHGLLSGVDLLLQHQLALLLHSLHQQLIVLLLLLHHRGQVLLLREDLVQVLGVLLDLHLEVGLQLLQLLVQLVGRDPLLDVAHLVADEVNDLLLQCLDPRHHGLLDDGLLFLHDLLLDLLAEVLARAANHLLHLFLLLVQLLLKTAYLDLTHVLKLQSTLLLSAQTLLHVFERDLDVVYSILRQLLFELLELRR